MAISLKPTLTLESTGGSTGVSEDASLSLSVTDTLTVTVQTSATESASYAYDLANDITTVNSTSKHYFLDAQDDGLYEVQFGDGILGKEIAKWKYYYIVWISN